MYSSENYQIASKFFIQGLGFIYFFAFFPFIFQIKGLIGSKGILPIKDYLNLVKSKIGSRAYYIVPTVFWINASDKALLSVVSLGIVCSVLLLFGFFPTMLLIILYILYLSMIHAGQDFLSFGWELYLMEITINAVFLALTSTPNPFVWISMNLLLFRFHIQAGAVKIQSQDATWRNLTALQYHYQTQPIANTAAWYAHKLPAWFHKLSALIMFIIELIVPFGIFFNEEIRLGVYFCFVGLQFFIWFTGNFSYLNYLTVIFSTILISDKFLYPLFGSLISLPTTPSTPIIDIIASLAGIILFTLQLISLWNHFIPMNSFSKILSTLRPFFIVNRYGIFAVMTTRRFEVIIEGSDDRIHWKEYTFKHKVSEVDRRPRRISPYQPRLDWQAWFLPFRSYQSERWFQNFLLRLLQGEKSVTDLLEKVPFKDHPPRYIRSRIYEYTFTDWNTKKTTGNWWQRLYIGEYSPIFSFKA